MKAIPMIFNTDMVKALLDGRKTVTRRPIKIPVDWQLHDNKLSKITSSHPKKGKWGALIRKLTDPAFLQSDLVVAPCQTGDLIYVRETYGDAGVRLTYKADDDGAHCMVKRWVSSIHMPRCASRLTLKVTDVRIERVQEITEEQAVEEGMPTDEECQKVAIASGLNWYQKPDVWLKNTWNRIYNNWIENPFAWVIEFEVIHQNIDTYLKQEKLPTGVKNG